MVLESFRFFSFDNFLSSRMVQMKLQDLHNNRQSAWMGNTHSEAVPIRPQGNGNGELFQNKKVKIEILTPFRQSGGPWPVAHANQRLPDW